MHEVILFFTLQVEISGKHTNCIKLYGTQLSDMIFYISTSKYVITHTVTCINRVFYCIPSLSAVEHCWSWCSHVRWHHLQSRMTSGQPGFAPTEKNRSIRRCDTEPFSSESIQITRNQARKRLPAAAAAAATVAYTSSNGERIRNIIG